MIKSVICIVASVLFLVINTVTLLLKPEFNFAINDEENYCVYYQKWIRTIVFMATIIIALICMYFAINLQIVISLCLLTIECLLVVIYNLVKYKGITVNGENIKVERLFRDVINTKFSKITNVYYTPNARLSIKLSNRKTFDVSFNSENFHKFYTSLIEANIKFKTGRVPGEESHVYLSKHDMTIRFPKTMFREYYQSKYYLRNSKYLFSARSLDNKEYIECYYKESGKNFDEFIDLIKTDLKVNEFKVGKKVEETIDGYDFTLVEAVNKNDDSKGRTAYVYKEKDGYIVLYCDYQLKEKENFYIKMNDAIRKPAYEDGKSSFSRI